MRWRQRIERAVAPASPLTPMPRAVPSPRSDANTIRLPYGISIEVEPGFDAGVASAVMRVLRVSSSC